MLAISQVLGQIRILNRAVIFIFSCILLFSASVLVFSADTEEPVSSLIPDFPTGSCSNLSFSPDGTLLVASYIDWSANSHDSYGATIFWQVADQHAGLIWKYGPSSWFVYTEVTFFSNKSLSVCVNSLSRGGHASVSEWDLAVPVAHWETPLPKILSFTLLHAVLSPNGNIIVVYGSQGFVLIDIYTGQILFTELNAEIRAMQWSQDGQYLFTASEGGVQKWKLYQGAATWVASPRTIIDLPSMPNKEWSQSRKVVFSQDGQYLAMVSDESSLQVWNIDTGKPIYTCPCNTTKLFRVCFSKDSRYLVSLDHEGLVRIWNALNGHQVYMAAMSNSRVAVLSPNNQFLAIGFKDGRISIWDVSQILKR